MVLPSWDWPTFYTVSCLAAHEAGKNIRLLFASQRSANSVTNTENSKYHLPIFPLGMGAQDVFGTNATQ